ncbi:type I methionyl aminopeptidase [Mycolicibacterium smegmatis]|uniref:type I methionyl aminopeptidase n=1 Tax=Mycolicibacterium smegmatis TaxID=1772 RepID=UPI0005DA467C|nr:type I methionyl aminopeptidase [Mycolicibacterium smegmatis]MCP2621891.1 type I methionyl aminopeptidase [Mycolicibacterium smegmatis]MDF1901203.1 type I methionyl aminopeptidase [Mycolicibacterium smegmatis]MDF1907291.1 type I methionyl aminopeptidase [Mycolicibacterium smegmatis]MDF1919830.1 type I methionyl aminopeptidase [Mycolicibacterium smegmatis]MDF1925737.1 type I methionyl aminopeptidase [Mycolicibacterium smegmatis]
MVDMKTKSDIDAMSAAGAVVEEALREVVANADVGRTTADLDHVAAQVLADHGATSPFLDYHPRWAPSPFPAVLCVSVNDAVVHGIPGPQVLADGDLVSVDFGAILNGWCGDAARSFVVGTPRPADLALIEATDAALAAGIEAARPGNTLGDIGHAISATVRDAGYALLADHGGHGIGHTMHEAPHVPNVGRRGEGMKLRPGLVIAIEPMLIADGTEDYVHDPDGWTLRTATGARAAHSEHTVAITDDGPRILTL